MKKLVRNKGFLLYTWRRQALVPFLYINKTALANSVTAADAAYMAFIMLGNLQKQITNIRFTRFIVNSDDHGFMQLVVNELNRVINPLLY